MGRLSSILALCMGVFLSVPAAELRADRPRHSKKRVVVVQPASPSTQPAISLRTPPKLRGNPVGGPLSAIYDRTEQEFRYAVQYKPSDQTATLNERTMAPWLVQEVPGSSSTPMTARIGAAPSAGSEMSTVDVSRPTVYTASSRVTLRDSEYEQLIYIWAFPRNRDGTGIQWHGIRTTLAPNRLPMVQELLTSEGQPIVLFVTHILEDPAKQEFGKPLPRRKLSIERSLEEQPSVAVARVLPRGAEPAGPAVYQDSATHAITTLLCRCMEQQYKTITETATYEILPLDILGDVHVPEEGPFRLMKGSPTPSTAPPSRPWLEQVLRIPRKF